MYHAPVARTVRRLALWAVATGLAVCVSWLGVQRVLATDAATDVPTVVPVDRLASPATGGGPPIGDRSPVPAPPASTPAPPPTPSTGASAGPASGGPATGTRPAPGAPASSTAPTAPDDGTDVRGYQLTGGRVVLEMTATSARLVSATPQDGWRVQAWQADGWLRVDFSRDATTSSLFATWNGHPPSVQTT
jgi:hypothetical protein